MTKLRYIRLPNPTCRGWAGEAGSDLNRTGEKQDERGVICEPVVYSKRNRYCPPTHPLPDQNPVIADMDSHEAASFGSHSQRVGSSWGRTSAALQSWQKWLLRSINFSSH